MLWVAIRTDVIDVSHCLNYCTIHAIMLHISVLLLFELGCEFAISKVCIQKGSDERISRKSVSPVASGECDTRRSTRG